MEKLQKLDFEEKLINEVSAHQCLYNKRCKEFSNRNKKNKVWEEISNLVNTPVSECKSKWKNIKDTFFHYVRLDRSTPSGSGAEKKIKWVHYDALQFLLPCLDAPSTISNYTVEDRDTNWETGDGDMEFTSGKEKKGTNHMEEIILDAIQSLDNKQPEPEPASESKLFLDSLVPRFERLSPLTRSYIQFKFLELLHQIEFESADFVEEYETII